MGIGVGFWDDAWVASSLEQEKKRREAKSKRVSFFISRVRLEFEVEGDAGGGDGVHMFFDDIAVVGVVLVGIEGSPIGDGDFEDNVVGARGVELVAVGIDSDGRWDLAAHGEDDVAGGGHHFVRRIGEFEADYVFKHNFNVGLFLVPGGVHGVVVGYFLVYFAGLVGGDLFDLLGRDACPDGVRRNDGVGEDEGTSGDNSACANDGAIEYGRAHSDEGIVVDRCAMDCHIMADGDIVANMDCGLLVESMEDSAILDVDMIANADGVDIATEDSAEPDAAAFADNGIADDGGVIGKEGILADKGCETTN